MSASQPGENERLSQRVMLLEEHVAHLEQLVETLSGELLTQGRQLEAVSREAQRLARLEQAVDSMLGERRDPLEEKPPHY